MGKKTKFSIATIETTKNPAAVCGIGACNSRGKYMISSKFARGASQFFLCEDDFQALKKSMLHHEETGEFLKAEDLIQEEIVVEVEEEVAVPEVPVPTNNENEDNDGNDDSLLNPNTDENKGNENSSVVPTDDNTDSSDDDKLSDDATNENDSVVPTDGNENNEQAIELSIEDIADIFKNAEDDEARKSALDLFNSAFIDVADVTEEQKEVDIRELAKHLGIASYHNTGLDKLKEKIINVIND